MSSERFVIDGKTYELPESRAGECARLNDELHAELENIEYPPLPKNCLSNKYNEPARKVWQKYRAKFRELLVEVKE